MSDCNLNDWSDEEEKLADELKKICDDRGQETNETKSAPIFHKMALNYQTRPPKISNMMDHDKTTLLMMKLIKSAALYNAAITRSQNESDFQENLKRLCVEILKSSGTEQTNANLIQEAEKVKAKIEDMRKFVNDDLVKDTDKNPSMNQEQEKINHIKNLQKKITDRYTKIMAELSEDCENVMGKPPCKFTVVGMGSLAREEITPYSDFEHIIVLEELSEQGKGKKSEEEKKKEKENVLNYFRWFSVIFQTVVLNLQETILPSVSIFSLNDKKSNYGNWFHDAITTRGISFDGRMPHACKFPLGRQEFTKKKPWKTELIKPVSEMLKYLTKDQDLDNGYHLKDILTKICFVYGNKTLFNAFKLEVHKILEEDDETIQINNVKEQMKEDLKKFAAGTTLLELLPSKKFNLKQIMYRSTTLFISALGRAYNIRKTSSFDIIEKLAKKKKISENAKHRLMYAVAIACEMRLKWYMKCQRQNDVVESKVESNTAIKLLLNLTIKNNIFSYFQTAYALQCDVSKRFELGKKFFFLNPTLFCSSLYYCLEEKEKFTAFTQQYKDIDYNKKTKLLTFDDCIEEYLCVESKIDNYISTHQQEIENQCLSIESENQQDKSSEAEYFKHYGSCLLDLKKFDKSLDYFKREENSLKKISNNCNKIKTSFSKSQPKKLRLIDKKPTTNFDTSSNERSTTPNRKEDTYKDESNKLSNCQQNIGQCLMEIKEFNQAIEYLELSLTNSKQISDSCNSKTLHKIGFCYIEKNELPKALDYLKQSLTISKRISKGVDSDKNISAISHNIGRCLIGMNKFIEALNYLKQSLAIRERISSGFYSDQDVSTTLHEIGRCLLSMNQLKEAMDYLRKSFAIKKQISQDIETDSDIPKTLHLISRCLMEMNEPNKALYYLKQSLAIFKEISPALGSDQNISSTSHVIGCCLMKKNEFTEAEFTEAEFTETYDYLKRSLEIQKRISRNVDIDQNISATLHKLGHCLMKNNNFTESMSKLKQSLAISKRIPQNLDSDSRISATLNTIGCCLIDMNKLNEALNYLKQSLAISKQISPNFDSDQNISTTLHEIGCCLIKIDKFAEALDYLKRSLAIDERISLGVDSDPDISETLYEIGRCLMETNQLTEALDYLKRSLAIRKQISLGVDSHRRILTTLHVIGCCLLEMNKIPEALDYLKQSLAIKKKISLDFDSDPNVLAP